MADEEGAAGTSLPVKPPDPDSNPQAPADLQSGHETLYDFYCMLCHEDDHHVEATCYCATCEEYLCATCGNYHRKSRLSRHHALTDAESMPRDRPLAGRVDKTITSMCDEHPTELLRYHCQNHGTLGCASCFALGHRACSDIVSIADKAEDLLSDAEFQGFVNDIDALQQESEDIIQQCDDNAPKVAEQYSSAIEAVRSHKQRVNTSFDVLESDLLSQAALLKTDDDSKLKRVSSECKAALDTARKMSSDVQTLQGSKKVCEMFILMTETRSKVQSLRSTLEVAQSKSAISVYKFEANMGLFDYLARGDVFGKISLQKSQSSTTHRRNANVTHVADVRVKSSEDKDRCLITGCVILPGNKLVITDFLNEKVKLIDTQSGKIMSELKVLPHPRDVAAMDKDKVAVTLECTAKILVLSVTDTVDVSQEIATNGKGRGVAYANGLYYVTFNRPGRLEILNLSGQVLQKVEDIFNCPDYVCPSNDGRTLYVSNYNSCEVVSLKSDGTLISRYTSDEMKGPQKLCTDDHGRVYVCDYRARCVHVIAAADYGTSTAYDEPMASDTRTVSDKPTLVLTEADGLYGGVFSVAYCKATHRLFVGLDGDVMKVYALP